MSASLLLLTLCLPSTLFCLSSSSSTSPPPLRLHKSIPRAAHHSREYIELARPLPSDHLTPSCTLRVLHHLFADTIGRPPVSTPYSPPLNCSSSWSHVVLELRASSSGDQYDRIAGVWLGAAEILRTSTAEPTSNGVFWKVRKDITRYESLLRRTDLAITVMLENIVNDELTGVYDITLTLLYYKGNSINLPSSSELSRKLVFRKDYRDMGLVNEQGTLGFEDKLGENPAIRYKEGVDSVNEQRNSKYLYETPADLILPISNDGLGEGFWFRIESESGVQSTKVNIPRNTLKAVLEVYVSFHGNDEFWYSNPPDSYIRVNNMSTGRGHGAYREVFVTIDGRFVGSVVPFPVIFTGGINPLFWEPVVAIGAFNLPCYDFDLTPFLGLIVDGKTHLLGLGVADSVPFWLVDANLHLWFDHGSSRIEAKVVSSHSPALLIERTSKFVQLDGSFTIVARRKSRFSGWVKSSAGNLTTYVSQGFRFKNSIKFAQNGTYKLVKQKVNTKTITRVVSEMGGLINRVIVRRKYPLRLITNSTLSGSKSSDYKMLTNVSHAMREKFSHGHFSSSLYNNQISGGWMVVKGHSVRSGFAMTNQTFTSKDEFGCYSRVVAATRGKLIGDNTTFSCTSSF
ncbi:peptide-N4-(N-acetyl-beta-glucosaminyl)asparagine amidase A [Diospyros lotus]|uniref:peptide-N4-(N-acetyl-beta- glucosaminyl)asparagine amidase A n=1 Tax=Diospyros lotus TaxID=55363 RepID=UPI002257D099|nr:peptide-N4-(N-acetyl-beta-glucosaminyl)asparagine amidase A [Diospyros lotus]